MTNIKDLQKAIEELSSIISMETYDGTSTLGDIDEISSSVQETIKKLTKIYDRESKPLKKTVRRRLISAIKDYYWKNRTHFNYPAPNYLSKDKIWGIADELSRHDDKAGYEFFGWYLEELNECESKWSWNNDRSVYPKQDAFFRDVVRELLK